MKAILKRELSAYFTSPIGYVFISVFFFFSVLFFYLTCLTIGSTDLSYVFLIMFYVLLIFIPVLTMRLMADEKKQKTDQLLLTAPVGLFRLVMGKFLAAFAVFLSSVFILLFFGIVLSFYAQVNWPMIFGNILGLLLIGSIFISAGLLISSLTENQMIAAIGAIGVNIMILLLDVLASVLPWKPLANVVSSLAVLDKYSDFTYGIFSVGNVLYFISVTVIFLFLTVRILERRRWA